LVPLCAINSGATRCHPYYGGNAPTRGDGTFVIAEDYKFSVGSVAEVTFTESCLLPDQKWTAREPNGPWRIR